MSKSVFDVECWCARCDAEARALKTISALSFRMNLCPTCGNKRCPKATDHRNQCSGSNETGQEGSRY